mgnify:CR=1 FL=1
MSRFRDYAVLLAATALLTLPNLGVPSLWDMDEGVNAECTREMLESGTWVVPTFNWELRTAKPIMLYWIQRPSFLLFGPTEVAARLPSALLGMGTVLLVYELARRMFDRGTGLLSGLVLASAIQFCMLSHAATPDAPLIFFTVLTLAMVWVLMEPRPLLLPPPGRGEGRGGGRFGVEDPPHPNPPPQGGRGQEKRNWLVWPAIPCGLAVLTKGPVGLAVPGMIVLAYLAWNRELGRVWDRRLIWGGLLWAAVAVPWYVLVTSETRGAYASAFFGNENVGRFMAPMENHRGPVVYYLGAIMVLFAPWCCFIGAAVWYGVAVSREAEPSAGASCQNRSLNGVEAPALGSASRLNRSAHRFLLCWVGVYLVFFSVAATKLPNYIAPLYPPLAILTARFLVRWRDGTITPPRWVMPTGIVGVGIVGVVTILALQAAGGVLPVAKMRTFPGLGEWAVVGLIPLTAAGVMAWQLRAGNRAGVVAAVTVAALAFVGVMAAGPVLVVDRYKAAKELVRESGANQPDRDIRLAGMGYFQESLVFYAHRRVERLFSPESAAAFLAMPHPSYLFVPEAEWAASVAGKVTVPHRVAARRYDFYRHAVILVVTNEPGQ